jgi:hypothetical protein
MGATLVFCLACLPVLGVAAQEGDQAQPEEQLAIYSLGQQSLSISAGLFIPLFYQAFAEYGGGYAAPGLSLGGVGSLQWGVHLDNHWLVGLEVGGMFAPSKDIPENVFYQLPITVKGAYIFHIYPFEVSLHLGAGLDVVRYASETMFNFILKPGVTGIWKYNSEWGFGLNVVYWFVPQPWADNRALSRMGNFLELSATAQYNF